MPDHAIFLFFLLQDHLLILSVEKRRTSSQRIRSLWRCIYFWAALCNFWWLPLHTTCHLVHSGKNCWISFTINMSQIKSTQEECACPGKTREDLHSGTSGSFFSTCSWWHSALSQHSRRFLWHTGEKLPSCWSFSGGGCVALFTVLQGTRGGW